MPVKQVYEQYNSLIKAFIAYGNFILGFILGMDYHNETGEWTIIMRQEIRVYTL